MLKTLIKKNIMTVFTLILGLALFFIIPLQIRKIPNPSGALGPRAFPYFCSFVLVLCSAISLISNYVKLKNEGDNDIEEENNSNYKKVIITFFCILIWFFAMEYIGFIISTSLLIAVTMFLLGSRNKVALVLTPLLFTIPVYIVFSRILYVPLPEIFF